MPDEVIGAMPKSDQPAILFDPPGQVTRLVFWEAHLAVLLARPEQDASSKRAIARARWEIAARSRLQPRRPSAWLICGPGPFGPVERLVEHLRSLRRIGEKDESVFRGIRDTRQNIRRLKRKGLSEKLGAGGPRLPG
jgi:hypothetical protein